MMEMQIEGNMVSDDDGGGSSGEDGLGREQGPEAKGRIRAASAASRKRQTRTQSRTIIEVVDDNDDVSSDEFLDLPGSLPRNSFGYDNSDYEPVMRNSSLTLDSANTKSNSNQKGKRGGKKGTISN